jgi:hypothetical protein
MKNNPQHQTLTVGELCAAIAEGRLPATLEDNDWYQVTARDVRRYANRRQQPKKAQTAPRLLDLVK